MTDCGRDMLYEYLGDCYNIQLELEDLSGSFETLISDIELVIGELSENLLILSSGFSLKNKTFSQIDISV